MIYREDHTPTFNGWITVDGALLESNELYASLSYADRMLISAHVMNKLVPLAEEPPQPDEGVGKLLKTKSFIYTYNWDQINEDYSCIIFEAGTGEVIFDEWFMVLKQHEVMSSIEDVDGLMKFLVQHGELLEGDRISFKFKDDGESQT